MTMPLAGATTVALLLALASPVAASAEPQNAGASATQTSATPAPAAQPKQHRAKSAARTPDSGPKKIVVRQGSVDEPTTQIVTGMSPEETSRHIQETGQLLNSTAEALKQIAARSLTADQQQTVSQIRNYMDVARASLKEGDISRAGTLALKAKLLTDDLTKYQLSPPQ